MLFFLPTRFILYHMTEYKRRKALQGSYVKIKGTDVLSTWKVLYGIVLLPMLFGVSNLVFFLILYYRYEQRFWNAFRFTLWFSVLFPLYVYTATLMYDHLYNNGRLLFIRIKYFIMFRKRGVKKMKELGAERVELEKKIIDTINRHKETILKHETDRRIIIERSNDTSFSQERLNELSTFMESL